MIQLQLLTGARPGELVDLRPCDIDTTCRPWEARKAEHKTSHHNGRERTLLFGPEARIILADFLTGRPADKPLFSPAEGLREKRTGKGRRPDQKPNPRKTTRKLRDAYSVPTYARAIAYACERAKVPHWKPLQLRHNASTAFRKRGGIDTAAVIAGHAHGSKVTAETYAEADLEKARQLIEQAG